MRTFLYIIWFLIPLVFFVLTLHSFLEKVGDKQRRENPGDFFRQGLFSLGCVLVAVIIDRYALESIAQNLLGGSVSLLFLEIILLPIVLWIGAMIVGPSRAILISKAPRPSEKGRRKPRR